MTAKRPAVAVNTFKDSLQRALSCVTNAVVTLSPQAYQPSETRHRLTLAEGIPVPLTAPLLAGQVRFGLSVVHAYRIIRLSERGPWKVQTAAYQYALFDADGREIFAYHWHPHVDDVPYPHVHVSHGAVKRDVLPNVTLAAGQNVLQSPLAAAHLPTRRVALEDMLRLLIEQFGVRPARPDWDDTLHKSRESFKTDRTWL